MKNNKIVPIILVNISCLLFIIAIVLVLNNNYYFKLSNKTENKETKQNQTQEEINNNQNIIEKENNQAKEELTHNNETITNQEIINNNVVESESSNETSTNEQIVESTKNEISVINYFVQEDEKITNTNQDDSSLREKAKNAFVTVVDFIFYDKEVKGYTFNELTTSAKLRIIKIALSIDNKIDEYFPDYKDVIKDKYDNITGKLAVKYLEFTNTLCEKVGTDTCNQAKEDFNTMKDSFSITWELIKELASSSSSKIKEFYETWRDTE